MNKSKPFTYVLWAICLLLLPLLLAQIVNQLHQSHWFRQHLQETPLIWRSNFTQLPNRLGSQ